VGRSTRSHAPKPLHDTVEDEIARLRDLEFKQLQARWRSVTGRDAPPRLPRHLLFAMIAYRIQAEAYGDLNTDTLRLLAKVGSVRSETEITPLADAFDQRRRELAPGTVLTREWNRQHHRVMVVADGFSWEGRTYDSLSKIAHAITGTKWNGPRFFGLRDNKPPTAKT
jgi:hypothetical protein